jgi:hypothetical protein
MRIHRSFGKNEGLRKIDSTEYTVSESNAMIRGAREQGHVPEMRAGTGEEERREGRVMLELDESKAVFRPQCRPSHHGRHLFASVAPFRFFSEISEVPLIAQRNIQQSLRASKRSAIFSLKTPAS